MTKCTNTHVRPVVMASLSHYLATVEIPAITGISCFPKYTHFSKHKNNCSPSETIIHGFRSKTWAITQSKVCSTPRLLYWDGCLHRNNNWNMKPGHVHTQSSHCEKYVTSWLNVGDLSNHPGCQWRTKHSWEPYPRPPQPCVTQYAAGSLCQCENPPSLCRTRLSQWTHLLRFSSATLNLQQIQRSLPKTACSF